MIAKQEMYYDSRDGVSKIHAIKWIPQKEIKCVLILAHGMAEHIERYDEFASYMAERGVLVAGNSHLGHGKSIGKSGKLGYFCKRDAATVLIRDMHRIKKMIQREYPGIPYIILGHSMGSYIVRNYLLRYGADVEGAVMVGTGMPSKALLAVSRGLAGIQDFFPGGKRDGKLLNRLVFGGYNKRIDQPETYFDWLSVNEENVKAYMDDPFCGCMFTINGFRTLFELIYKIHDKESLQNLPENLPVLLISGDEDPVGEYGKGVRRTEQSLKDAGLQDVTVSLHRTARHEILNEKERKEIYEEIFKWIDGKLRIGSSAGKSISG